MIIIGSTFGVKQLQASDAHGSVKIACCLITIKSKFNSLHLFAASLLSGMQKYCKGGTDLHAVFPPNS